MLRQLPSPNPPAGHQQQAFGDYTHCTQATSSPALAIYPTSRLHLEGVTHSSSQQSPNHCSWLHASPSAQQPPTVARTAKRVFALTGDRLAISTPACRNSLKSCPNLPEDLARSCGVPRDACTSSLADWLSPAAARFSWLCASWKVLLLGGNWRQGGGQEQHGEPSTLTHLGTCRRASSTAGAHRNTSPSPSAPR